MDANFYRDVNRFAVHTAWLHGILKAYAVYGVALFGLLVLLTWWYARSEADPPRAVAATVWAAAGTAVAVGLNQFIVHAVSRPRPYFAMKGMEVLVSRSHDFSFPSDHATAAGAAVAGIWIVSRYDGRPVRLLAAIGTVLALVLAFSRVYVGAHYPGDVAAGLLIGAAISVVGWLVIQRPLTAVVDRLSRVQPLRPLVLAEGPAQSRTRVES